MKIGIIGVGSVGSAIASRLQADGTAHEIVLIDIDTKRAKSSALDLSHAESFGGTRKIIAGSYKNLKGADIVIISAGANQKPGESRDELVEKNATVMMDIVPQIMNVVDKKKIILIVVTNPLDSMVTAVQKLSHLPANQVIGTGTMLDSARLKFELAKHFDVSPLSIDGFVLGEHGNTSVIDWNSVSIDGVKIDVFPVKTKLNAKMKTEIESRVRGAAGEIIKGRGATWDGIAASTLDLVKCIVTDERRVLPVSTVDSKNKLAYSLPRIVSASGIVTTLPTTLNLSASINAIKKTYRKIA